MDSNNRIVKSDICVKYHIYLSSVLWYVYMSADIQNITTSLNLHLVLSYFKFKFILGYSFPKEEAETMLI